MLVVIRLTTTAILTTQKENMNALKCIAGACPKGALGDLGHV